MSKRFIVMFVGSALGLIGASGLAFAGTIGRFECTVIGAAGQEPIDATPGHFLASVEYSCFGVDGLLKDAVHTASSASEWVNQKGTFLRGGGTHRAPGGLAVTQVTEGSGIVVMKDGKPIGTATTGTGIFKFASGNLAALSGKTFKFTTAPTGLDRFEMEFTD
jgi:hypothetical protein